MKWLLVASVLCISVLSASVEVGSDGGGVTGSKEKKKVKQTKRQRLQEAKEKCSSAFVDSNQMVFDEKGRVLRWPVDVVEVACTSKLKCKVIKSEQRKFRTADEELRQKMLVLDAQAEQDQKAGNLTDDDKKAKRRKKEERIRCHLYGAWLEEYQADKAEAKDAFWEYLSTAYEDFAQLRTTARSPASSRKKRALTKLYRHIALQVHPDKLPHACNGKAHEGMMKVILNEATRLKEADKVDQDKKPGYR
jgi:hypothetical protein